MRAAHSSHSHPYTPKIEQQPSHYVSGYVHLQQPSTLHIGNPPLRRKFSPYSPPLSEGGNLSLKYFHLIIKYHKLVLNVIQVLHIQEWMSIFFIYIICRT